MFDNERERREKVASRHCCGVNKKRAQVKTFFTFAYLFWRIVGFYFYFFRLNSFSVERGWSEDVNERGILRK